MKYYLVAKNNGIMSFLGKLVELESSILNEDNESQKYT